MTPDHKRARERLHRAIGQRARKLRRNVFEQSEQFDDFIDKLSLKYAAGSERHFASPFPLILPIEGPPYQGLKQYNVFVYGAGVGVSGGFVKGRV